MNKFKRVFECVINNDVCNVLNIRKRRFMLLTKLTARTRAQAAATYISYDFYDRCIQRIISSPMPNSIIFYIQCIIIYIIYIVQQEYKKNVLFSFYLCTYAALCRCLNNNYIDI